MLPLARCPSGPVGSWTSALPMCSKAMRVSAHISGVASAGPIRKQTHPSSPHASPQQKDTPRREDETGPRVSGYSKCPEHDRKLLLTPRTRNITHWMGAGNPQMRVLEPIEMIQMLELSGQGLESRHRKNVLASNYDFPGNKCKNGKSRQRIQSYKKRTKWKLSNWKI